MGLGLVQKLKEDNIDFNLDFIAFELDPNIPADGSDLFDVYPKEQLMRSVESINKLAAEVNLKLNNINERFNTRRAHLCGYYAKDKGLYEQYALEMFKTYFEYKKNVYLPHIIDEIAIKIGLDPIEMDRLVDSGLYDERLAEDYKTGKRYGISSVPTFIINNKIKIAGVRQYEDFKKFFTDEFMNSL